jgi:hypothetical protein
MALIGALARPLIAVVVTISSKGRDRFAFLVERKRRSAEIGFPFPFIIMTRAVTASLSSFSFRTVLREIAIITANDTNVLQVRRCRGCRVVWRQQHKNEEFHNSSSSSNNKKKRKTTKDDNADDDISSHRGVRSFGGMGTLVLSDQRILAYVGATRLFHAQWYDATTANFQLHIQYSKNTREPLLCLTVVDAPSLFSAVTSTTPPSTFGTNAAAAAAASERRRRTTATTTTTGDIEYRFETTHASILKRRIQYILHWYLDLECAPGTKRRYATEIFC